jgi:hypothetical protein
LHEAARHVHLQVCCHLLLHLQVCLLLELHVVLDLLLQVQLLQLLVCEPQTQLGRVPYALLLLCQHRRHARWELPGRACRAAGCGCD